MATAASQSNRAQKAEVRATPAQHRQPQQQSKRRSAEKAAVPKKHDAKARAAAERMRAAGGEESWNTKPVYMRPHLSEVVAAVESLYADKLKPFGRILLKRIRERNAAAMTAAARAKGNANVVVDTDATPLIDPKCLRRLCETCERLQVAPEEGKEYSVLLVGGQRNFVDVSSLVDCYTVELWERASEYFEGLRGEEMMLPGGRYACAQVLTSRQLPFLAGYSLGEVCHIVQLAVSQKRILGYFGGIMVPFGFSMEQMKEQCAVWQQPVCFAKNEALDMPLATWEEARACLWELLNSAAAPGQLGVINLSNVKRLFCSRFGLELSETALGHAHLTELLQDSRFCEFCSLEWQGKSQVVVQRLPEGAPSMEVAFRQAVVWTPNFTAGIVADEKVVMAADVPSAQPSSLDPTATLWSPLTELHISAHATSSAATPGDGAFMLSSYVQQLLELDPSEGRGALQKLSEYGSNEMGDASEDVACSLISTCEVVVAAGGAGHRGGASVSRSTSEGSGSDDESDDGVANLRPFGFSHRIAAPSPSPRSMGLTGLPKMAPPPGLELPTIAPPPGLEGF